MKITTRYRVEFSYTSNPDIWLFEKNVNSLKEADEMWAQADKRIFHLRVFKEVIRQTFIKQYK